MHYGPLPDAIKFSPEEMARVLSLDNKLFNEMAALDDLHNSTVAIFRLYAEKRDSLTTTLTPASMTENVGATFLTKEQKDKMKPRSVELDMLVEAMVQRTEQDGKQAWECLEALHTLLEKEFKLKHKLEMKQGYGANKSQPYYHHYKA
jgi:hypothetical protein